MKQTKVDFHRTSSEALEDPQIRANFRRAMDGLMTKRAAMFPDSKEWNELRSTAESIRNNALARLPELLQELETNLKRNGIQVHWAETPDEANEIVLGILKSHNAKTVVKGKSMVSEETEMNHFLEKHGIETLETDLGEYIIQLDHEPPSHIVMPAIHKSRKQIAHLFREKIKTAGTAEEAHELTAVAREVLRKKFSEADAGISGVNFAIAGTGTLCLIENEGNGRMSTSAPPLHIAITGIEKVIPTLEDLPPLLTLLPRSATGQAITTYVNFISSPRKEDERDGPEEVHLVLLDNGRSRMYADPQLREVLRCIRCGACMNHCPVYTRIGGHAYDAVYPGPIGSILTPQMEGLEKRSELPFACSLCNACNEVCPVKIPIAGLLNRLRRESVEHAKAERHHNQLPVEGSGSNRTLSQVMGWNLWMRSQSNPKLAKLSNMALRTVFTILPANLSPPMKAWTKFRSKPRPAGKTLHEMAKDKGIPNE